MEKYRILVEAVKAEIINGTLLPGTKLPGQKVFARNFNVSEITAKRAFNELKKAGLIERHAKSGSYVRERIQYFKKVYIICTRIIKNPSMWLGDYWAGVEKRAAEFGITVEIGRHLPENMNDSAVIMIGEDRAMIDILQQKKIPFITSITRNRLSCCNVHVDYPKISAALADRMMQDGARRLVFLGNMNYPTHKMAADGLLNRAEITIHHVTNRNLTKIVTDVLSSPNDVDGLIVMGGGFPFAILPQVFASRLPLKLGFFTENRAISLLKSYAYIADYNLLNAGMISFDLLYDLAANPALPSEVRSPNFSIITPQNGLKIYP